MKEKIRYLKYLKRQKDLEDAEALEAQERGDSHNNEYSDMESDLSSEFNADANEDRILWLNTPSELQNEFTRQLTLAEEQSGGNNQADNWNLGENFDLYTLRIRRFFTILNITN